MAAGRLFVLSFLLATALSAPVQVDEAKTIFLWEDFHIMLPSLKVEVSFKNRSAQWSPEVDLFRDGSVVNTRAKLNQKLSHLIIDKVGEGDEGVYTVKDPENPESVKRIKLTVRDCTVEHIIKYGDYFRLPVMEVTPPLTLEYRPISVEANQTSRPALMLLTSTGLSRDGYQGRITVDERHVTLSAVTGADEGSYTVRDAKGDIQRKVCLKVRGHQDFVTLQYGKRLKINLILNSSLVQLFYTPEKDPTPRLLLDKGEFTNAPEELGFQDRLSIEGSLVFLDQVTRADVGVFEIKDILGFVVANIHLGVEPYKLESLYVAIIALVGLLVFLLLVCLLSCLIKVKKRAKRAAALEKLAQNAGKEDEGEAFRQVVKNITKLSEESKHSQADNTEKSQSTEVDIKGLEVSSKEVGLGNLETSDSGVGFNTALPLDTDTDAPDPTSESVAVTISAAPETKSSPPPAAEPSAPPALEIKSSPVAETKTSPAPETKKTPDPPVETKLDLPKPADVKPSPTPSPEPKADLSPAHPKPAPSPSPEPKAGLSPADPKLAPSPSPEPKATLSPADPKPAPTPSPEPKAGLSPADPKPAPTPSPEPKPSTPKATTPTPVSALAPTPEPQKPTTPEPITNGTPEPGLDPKSSPDHAEIISSSSTKAAPPKTPEVELKSSGATLEASKDGTAADDTTTTTTTT